jgi:hypothetical protein
MSLSLSKIRWGWALLGLVLAVGVFIAVQLTINVGYGLVIGFQMRQAPPQEVLMAAFASLPFILLGAGEVGLGAYVGGRLAASKSEASPQSAGLLVGIGVATVVVVLSAIQGVLDVWVTLYCALALTGGWLAGFLVARKGRQ